ncbi:MAG: hypothetical protein GXO26_03655, partial [Crenarchaeota archaeon]|nr:hypothetical protein [Thermoproteota archaeon]
MKNNKELEIRHSLTLNNEKYGVIDFENQFGKGADIVLIHVDSRRAYIFEIKECSLDLNDVSSSTGAIEQIEYTERKLKELGYIIASKILIHV